MATGADVLTLLCPNSEWTITGNNYDSIDWFGKSPAITREQFETTPPIIERYVVTNGYNI
jgi:hypothetical protein